MLIDIGVWNLYWLTLLIRFVTVKALTGLLTQIPGFEQFFNNTGEALLHSLKTCSHHSLSVDSGIDPHDIKQVGRSHRPAKALHGLVYLAEISPIMD